MRARAAIAVVAIALALLAALWGWIRTEREEIVEPGGKLVVDTPGERDAPLPTSDTLMSAEPASAERAAVGVRDVAPVATAAAETGMATLRAHVLSKETGAAIAGIDVTAMPIELPDGWRATGVGISKGDEFHFPTTGVDGLAELVLTVGRRYQVYAQSDDGAAGSRKVELEPLAAGEARELIIELPTTEDVMFFGRVVTDEGRLPIAGASVLRHQPREFEGADFVDWEPAGPGGSDVSSDADGRFELRVASWRLPMFRIEAPGRSVALTSASGNHSSSDRALHVPLRRSATLAVRVTDAFEALAAGVRVRVSVDLNDLVQTDGGWTRFYDGQLGWTAAADAGGLAVFPNVPSHAPLALLGSAGQGQWRLMREAISLAPGEEREVECVLAAHGDIAGDVHDASGASIEGAVIWLVEAEYDSPIFLDSYRAKNLRSETRSNADGHFSFADVPVGSWWVGLAPRADFVSPAEVVRVGSAGDPVRVSLVRYDERVISGRVDGPSGEPVSGAAIFAVFVPASGGWPLTVGDGACKTKADGAFTLSRLPEGPLRIAARPPRATNGELLASSELVDVQGGEHDVVLRLRRAGAIRVVVAGHAATVGFEAEVQASTSEEAEPFALEAFGYDWIAEDGGFDLRPLLPGTYGVFVRAGDNIAIVERVVVSPGGVEDLSVVLQLGAKLRVRAEGLSSTHHCSVRLGTTFVGGVALENAAASTLTVPPGTLQIELRSVGDDPWSSPAPIATAEVTVAPGEEREVVLRPK